LFKKATDDDGHFSFLAYILPTLKKSSSYHKEELIKQNWLHEITRECATKKVNIPLCLIEASKTWKKKSNDHKLTKRRLSQSLGFTACAHKINAARFASITETTVKTYSAKDTYPPLKTWVYETGAIRD